MIPDSGNDDDNGGKHHISKWCEWPGPYFQLRFMHCLYSFHCFVLSENGSHFAFRYSLYKMNCVHSACSTLCLAGWRAVFSPQKIFNEHIITRSIPVGNWNMCDWFSFLCAPHKNHMNRGCAFRLFTLHYLLTPLHARSRTHLQTYTHKLATKM